MYLEDSFFTLTAGARAGLLFLSGVLTALCFASVWRIRSQRRYLGILLAIVLFYLFVWLSPQIYYVYYVAVFENLPWQIVVKDPPELSFLLRLLTFTDRSNLSFHGQGALGWGLILCALLPRRSSPG